MTFLSGVQVIHVPASALNNAGADAIQQTDNKVAVKKLRMGGRLYPYVSAQAWRYWLRTTLRKRKGWQSSPMFREGKIAYTDANPIQYDDDDVFGYMRAPSRKQDAVGEGGVTLTNISKGVSALTRVSPLRVGSLVGISGQMISTDYGTMSRHEGDPVPYEHEFYAGSLRGLFSLDLSQVGVFTATERSGYLNLDDIRKNQAKSIGAVTPDGGQTYIMPDAIRWHRIKSVLEAFPLLEGGAKQAVHATDITPVVVVMAVFEGGNNPFYPIIHPDEYGHVTLHVEGLMGLLDAWQDQLLSPIYIGWVPGYPPENPKTEKELKSKLQHDKIVWGHPREVFKRLINDLESNPSWWAPMPPFADPNQ